MMKREYIMKNLIMMHQNHLDTTSNHSLTFFNKNQLISISLFGVDEYGYESRDKDYKDEESINLNYSDSKLKDKVEDILNTYIHTRTSKETVLYMDETYMLKIYKSSFNNNSELHSIVYKNDIKEGWCQIGGGSFKCNLVSCK